MRKKPYFAIAGAVLFWSSSFPIFKQGLKYLSAFDIVALRHWVATLLLGLLLVLFPRARPTFLSPKNLFYIGLMALGEPILYFLFEANALQHTSAGQAGMIVALMPVFTVIAARLVLKEPLSSRRLLGIAVAAAGVIVLTLSGTVSFAAANPLLGNTLEIAAMISAAIYVVYARRLSSDFSPLFLTFSMSLLGSLAFTPIMLIENQGLPLIDSASAPGFLAALYLGACVSCLAYFLYNYALGYLGAGEAGVFTNMIPLVALAFSQGSGIEPPLNACQWFGCALIVSGVVLAQKWFSKLSGAL